MNRNSYILSACLILTVYGIFGGFSGPPVEPMPDPSFYVLGLSSAIPEQTFEYSLDGVRSRNSRSIKGRIIRRYTEGELNDTSYFVVVEDNLSTTKVKMAPELYKLTRIGETLSLPHCKPLTY